VDQLTWPAGELELTSVELPDYLWLRFMICKSYGLPSSPIQRAEHNGCYLP
jgi:hypothetical protein